MIKGIKKTTTKDIKITSYSIDRISKTIQIYYSDGERGYTEELEGDEFLQFYKTFTSDKNLYEKLAEKKGIDKLKIEFDDDEEELDSPVFYAKKDREKQEKVIK